MTRPLVIAVGNPSRGDDGLGPALLALLDGEGADTLLDFQLQVEHALDIAGRSAVLFVDAARPGAAGDAGQGVALTRVAPADALPPLSHALTPSGVLHVARRLGETAPACWQLAIEGEAFGLGEGLSAAARARLPRALAVARHWIAERGAAGRR